MTHGQAALLQRDQWPVREPQPNQLQRSIKQPFFVLWEPLRGHPLTLFAPLSIEIC